MTTGGIGGTVAEITDGLREKEPDETEVAAVEVDDERESEKLAFVETDFPDWLDRRANLFAKLSIDAFLVCDGDRFGILGASLVFEGVLGWPGATK